jgi:hypothetical protein
VTALTAPSLAGQRGRILALAAVIVAGCIAQPIPRSLTPPPAASSVDAPTNPPSELASEPVATAGATEWHAVVVGPSGADAFQRDPNGGLVAGGRTVWRVSADGSLNPADPIEPSRRFGVIGGAHGFVDWDTPGIVRWSPDALTWFDDPSGPIAANLSTIVPVDDRLLLVGQAVQSRVGAWWSDDGRSWSEAIGAPMDLWAAAEWPGHGIVAAGGSGPQTTIWSSPDLSSWSAVGTPRPTVGNATVGALAASPGRVVAIGDVDGRSVAWWTTDLQVWTEAPPLWGPDALLESVTRIGETFFIAGRRSARPALWVSETGMTWSAVDLPLEAGQEGEVGLVAEVHRQPLAFGFRTHDEGNGGWSRTADLVWVLGRWPSG